ncbi:MAG: hypothetical protein WCT14_14025 [Treponemataceae bacterium]
MREIDSEIVRKAWKLCTWGNSNNTVADWLKAFQNNDVPQKKHIFQTLFREDPDGSYIRALYGKDELSLLLREFDTPLTRTHLEKRRKVMRYLYCGIKEPIPELDWIIHE